MTQLRTVSLDLPDDMLMALGLAAAAGCPPAEYLRAVLGVALADSPARGGGREEAIRQAIHRSGDWLDLQRRLRARGFVLRRAADGGLAVHGWPRDRAVLRIEEIGYSLAGLVLKFGAAFPGDPGAARRARLGRAAA